MGWGWIWSETHDIWYHFPDIGNYHVIRRAVFNICPTQAWAQVGGDEKNSYYLPYTFPTSKPDFKWEITVPTDIPDYNIYGFDHLVVGTGGKIYASLASSWHGDNDPSYIAIINPYGYIEKKIKVEDVDFPIPYLVQNSNGDIFFAGSSSSQDKTFIYKIVFVEIHLFKHSTSSNL